MSILLFILNEQPPDIIEGYSDYLLLAAEYLGYGSDSSLWTTAQRDELDRRIQEAYRYVMYPNLIPGEKLAHVWSFLSKTATITTSEDDYDQNLPSDFGGITGDFTFAAGTGYSHVAKSSPEIIRKARSYESRSGRPEFYAIRWRNQSSGYSQRQEVLWHPTPDGSYELGYSYAVLVRRLTQRNPYPLGGIRISQVMTEAVKAVAEAVKNGSRGDQWGIFMESLVSTIVMDRGVNVAPTVGALGPADGKTLGPGLIHGTVSYYYGPDADGNYTLES